MSSRSTRRRFLKTSAVASAGYLAASGPKVWAAKSSDGKLRIAKIGAGGMGSSDLDALSKCGCNIVALCDVDEENSAGSRKRFSDAKFFHDFREMFDKMANEFDAVCVSTPDHTHAVATMMAMKHSKHVYTQKPLTHDVYEARKLTEAARETKLVTQMGNQGTAHNGLREAVEVIQSGAIGHVKEVHVWTNRPIWPQGLPALFSHGGTRQWRLSTDSHIWGKRGWGNHSNSVEIITRSKGELVKPPSTLKWDLWLGTAPERPYDPMYLPFKWRGWWDYGTGALGDMACHTANMAFMACKLGYPTSVEAEMSEYNNQSFPLWSVIKYEFPAREGLPPLKWTWYDGGSDKPTWVNEQLKKLAHGNDIPGSGSLLIGEKGTLFSPNDYGSSYKLLPEKDFADYKPPTPRLPRFPGGQKDHPWHWQEWVDACLANKPEMCMSNFGYAGPLTETVVLGCVAMRAGKKIAWDGPNMKVTNDKDANRYLRRQYRKGWTL